MKTKFEVIYKFADVIDHIEANTKEEALEIAKERLISDYNPQNDTQCSAIVINNN